MQFNFNHEILIELYGALKSCGYRISPIDILMRADIDRTKKMVIIRHDVDKYPDRALKMANLEANNDVVSIYFFRYKHLRTASHCIDEISKLGHKIGYHYENLANQNGNVVAAMNEFNTHLCLFRKRWDIQFISMHGSPFSRYNNSKMWINKDASEFDLIDVSILSSLEEFLYLTDTGGHWNNPKYNIRDTINSDMNSKYTFKSTNSLIDNIKKNRLPKLLMINIHPQRWSDNPWICFLESTLQHCKNPIKYSVKILFDLT
jgi:hypothetical protein